MFPSRWFTAWIPLATLLIGLAGGRRHYGQDATTQPNEAMVVNTLIKNMIGDRRPPWCHICGAGTLKAINSGRFDRHYHDCDEYWLIVHGKAKVWSAGKTFYIHDGDIFCTPAGQVHDVLEIYEPIEGFYFENDLKPGGRAGHLHHTLKDALGHPVPTLPVPADFPKD